MGEIIFGYLPEGMSEVERMCDEETQGQIIYFEDGRNASLSKSVEAEKGTTYRAKAEVTVWINGKSETKTITTTGKTA